MGWEGGEAGSVPGRENSMCKGRKAESADVQGTQKLKSVWLVFRGTWKRILRDER